MSKFKRAWVLVAAGAVALAAAGCIPPPEETPPTTAPPAPPCWAPESSAMFDLSYLGPANTVGNALRYPSNDGSCTGGGIPTNLASGTSVNDARTGCVAMVPTYRGTPARLDEYYTGGPTDLWLC